LNGEFIGSPLKKQRASVSQADENALRKRIESGLFQPVSGQPVSGTLGNAATEMSQNAATSSNSFGVMSQKPGPREIEDEEL
jgi:hypothetical protein